MPGITDLQTNQSTQSLVDFLNADPSQVAFGLENQIDQLFQDYIIAKNSGDTPTAQMLEEQINSLQAEVIRLKNMRGDTSYAMDMMNNLKSKRAIEAGKGSAVLDMEGRPQLKDGGDFPDLTGDGKVTQADILKGRGVFAEGDEVQMGMMEMEMEPEGDDIQESLMAIQGVNQEAAPLDQFVQAVIQMIQAGASEQEVIEMLRQAGLDEEDINAVFQAVMQSLQGPGIDQELAALG